MEGCVGADVTSFDNTQIKVIIDKTRAIKALLWVIYDAVIQTDEHSERFCRHYFRGSHAARFYRQ